MRGKAFPPALVEAARERYLDQQPVRQIAATLGVSQDTIWYWCRSRGWPRRRPHLMRSPRPTPRRTRARSDRTPRDAILALRQAGWSDYYIAKVLGQHQSWVTRKGNHARGAEAASADAQ